MPPKLTSLLVGRDNSEIIRDEIAAILLVEQEHQQTLAVAESEDPLKWKLRIFTERSNPWSEFVAAPDSDTVDATPIVNVGFESVTYDPSKSDPIHRQQATGIYNIDCYTYGVSEDAPTGHIPGDEMAAIDALRAARLVRQILMSAHYRYLGLPRGIVGNRWPQSIRVVQPQIEGKAVQHVVAARIAFEVTFNEFSPQHEGEPLELISFGVFRKETGELYFTADYGESEDS